MALNPNWQSWNLDFQELGVVIDGKQYGFFSGSVSMDGSHIEAIILDAQDGGTAMIKPDHPLFEHLKEGVLRTPWMLQRIACWREEVAA